MKTALSPSPADINRRIAELTNETAAIKHGGPPLTEVLASSESELLRARDHFIKHGFAPIGAAPGEREHYRWLAMRGALMLIGQDVILGAERQRLEASSGISYDPERLAALRAELRPLLAQREQQWREAEQSEQFPDRSGFDPELYLVSDHDLGRIAAGEAAEEATA
jgi:hypothetical protein